MKQLKKPQIAPGVHPGIGLDQLKQLKCTCGSHLFIPCSHAYYASPFQSVTAMPTLVQVPQGFICSGCGKQNNFGKEAIQNDQEEESKTPSENVNN